ncbi:Glycosyl hydrolases family 43 [Botrimarina colliarenosi]|uniref:Glycosyl hydrolases family 43 n=1 Tax=Botrimarina colliarenosi TaxID=2528001 RepID=A0A5C5ZWL6_9BACT|nr:DUF2961 domain-containing protein [Botrimarina colliarenosi]TWT92012.1 Glycosyl hydrolases family 43 [Botrimarina colliarenosi]
MTFIANPIRLSIATLAALLAPVLVADAKTLVECGEFTRIYDPGVGEEKAWYINDHCFIQGPRDRWHLFGITHEEPLDPADEDNLAHATAATLLQQPWEKRPFALTVAPDAPWLEQHLWAPHVIQHDGLYYMFYCAGDADHSRYKIHLATSSDLKDWARHPANPMVIDGYDARDPFVLRHDGKWLMYYTANSQPEGGNHLVACVESDDLLHWGNRRVVFTDPTSGTFGGPTESPFVVRRGAKYYLFIGPRDGYDGTDVFVSDSPFLWRDEDLVGHFPAHAAEVVRDERGEWWISRCGWGKGGVYLAPLTWSDALDDADTNVPVAVGGPPPVTTGTLVRQMVDFDRLCETPVHPYKTLQVTSTDRRSDTPGGPDWFANSDGFGGAPIPPFERVLKKPGDDGVGEYLLADIEGPGAIVRTWTADINGNLRVYLDDADTPIYDGPAERFLHHPWDTFTEGSGVSAETLEGAYYQRDAAYCPMPFAKRCRIVWTGKRDHVHFYYVQFRKYLGDTPFVETFQPDDLATYAADIKHVSAVLKDPDANHSLGGASTESIDVTLAPGQTSEALRLEGPAAIEQLRLRVEAADETAALRQTVMHVTFDDWSVAQVQSPVGDFFAAAPGVNPYVSLPFTVESNGRMTSRYVMPYRRSARLAFQNLGDQPVRVTGEASSAHRDWDDARSMHFYARWRMLHDISTPPQFDVPFLFAHGSGRYVGTASLMRNTARGVHMGGTWWGEGDEKVYVDDDRIPSWFGTGSEDYYNYAWSAVDIFSYPYAGQPRNDGPGNRGFVTNYRFHFLDDQPFTERIAFTMELLSNHPVDDFSYGCQAYHYGRPGMIDDHRPITSEDVRRPTLPTPWKPLAIFASAGATFLEPEALTSAEHEIKTGDLWSEGKLFVWSPDTEGETLTLKLPVNHEGTYEVRLGMAIDPDSGVVSATLDGKPFGFGGKSEAMPLHSDRRTMLRASESEAIKLTQGDHELVLRYEGGAPRVGVDFVWLQPSG